MPIEKNCIRCGAEFAVPRCRSSARYCSNICRAENWRGANNPHWKGGKMKLSCTVCGKPIEVKPCHWLKGAGKYCSDSCRHKGFSAVMKGRFLRRIEKVCQTCGKKISVKMSHAKTEGTYCSRKCMTEGYKDRYANMKYDKIDSNQAEIVSALEKAGASVTSLSRMKFGCPDLCVGFRGSTYLIEVKTKRGTPTPAQKKWISNWVGHVAIARSVDEALKIIGVI